MVPLSGGDSPYRPIWVVPPPGTTKTVLSCFQFSEVEEPVRRRVQTVSVAGGNLEQLETLRGFELLPPQVSFGVLKEGCTYVYSVLLKNIGIDSCRYKVKQPPPSTGLRVLYKPGPVSFVLPGLIL